MSATRSHTATSSRRIIDCHTQGRRANDYRVTFENGQPVEVLSHVRGRFGARDYTRTLWKAGREMSITAACAIRAAQALLTDDQRPGAAS